LTGLRALPAVDSISDRKEGAKKVGRDGEVDREQQPEKKSQQEERSAGEAEETGDPQAGQHLIQSNFAKENDNCGDRIQL
jgi:hypothetical protein